MNPNTDPIRTALDSMPLNEPSATDALLAALLAVLDACDAYPHLSKERLRRIIAGHLGVAE